MKFFSLFIACLATLSSSLVFAGQDRGGGRGIVCRDSQKRITSVTLLDYFEAKQTIAIDLDLGPGATYQAKIQYVLHRLRLIDPLFAQTLLDGATSFEANTAFVGNGDLAPISDITNAVTPPPGCTEEQMAANKVSPLAYERKFLVDSQLWKASDETTKAGLVLHELIYAKARALGETKSDHARYYGAILASKQAASLSAHDYASLLYRIGWTSGSVGPEEGGCYGNFSLISEGVSYYADCDLIFDSRGRIQRGSLAHDSTFESSLGPIDAEAKRFVGISSGRFLVFASLAHTTRVQFGISKIDLPAESTITLGQDGRLQQSQVGGPMTITAQESASGRAFQIGKWNIIYACPNGKITTQEDCN